MKKISKPEKILEIPTLSQFLKNVDNSDYKISNFIIPDIILLKNGTALGIFHIEIEKKIL